LTALPPSARSLIESAPLAHVVTLNADGSPQVTCVWVGVEGDQLYFASLTELVKIRNLRRDSRIVISIEAESQAAWGIQEYIVIYGTAEVREGGGAAALQRLAHRYMSLDTRFPDMDDPPAGFVVAVTVDRIRGVGPWMEGS
jgi:PPOX class probable F420-dependent enzyme